MMRTALLSLFFSFTGLPVHSQVNLRTVFPDDINQYPLLFERYETATHAHVFPTDTVKTIMHRVNPVARNRKTERFIAENQAKRYVLAKRGELPMYPVATYKYLVSYTLVELGKPERPTGTALQEYQTGDLRVFASCFYILDRQTGYCFRPYIAHTTSPDDRSIADDYSPPRDPSTDRSFFSDLEKYIAYIDLHNTVPPPDNSSGRKNSQISNRERLVTQMVGMTASFGALFCIIRVAGYGDH